MTVETVVAVGAPSRAEEASGFVIAKRSALNETHGPGCPFIFSLDRCSGVYMKIHRHPVWGMQDAPDEDGLSAYELERRENIRQNNLRLQELGIEPMAAPSRVRSYGSSNRPATKRRAPMVTEYAVEGLRRSSRHRVATEPYSDESPLPQGRRPAAPERRRPYEGPDDNGDGGSDGGDSGNDFGAAHQDAVKPQERAPASAGFARAVKLEIPELLERHLGRQISELSTKDSAVRAMSGRPGVRFSKYSGSLEWKNAVVLWVNIGGSDYKNVFFDGGARMTWYASPNNHEGTPVVARLLSKAEVVLLFCRLPGMPYVCCGRLEYVSHVPRRQPLKFEWALVDLPKLRGQPDFDELLQ